LEGKIVKVPTKGETEKGETEKEEGTGKEGGKEDGAKEGRNGEKEKNEEIVMKFKGHWDKEVEFEDLRNSKVHSLNIPFLFLYVSIPRVCPF
jgi:hypothetical protein